VRANKILVPFDFSTCGKAALDLATVLARDSGARLLLLHVDETPFLVAGGEYFEVAPVVSQDELRKRLSEVVVTDPNVPCERRVETGNPTDEIVRMATEENVDFIVLGTHGRRGLTRLLLGSIAEAVMRQAPCPVISVRENPNKKRLNTEKDQGKQVKDVA
jgi:nucleotide-binding universal stress UspA family protein